MSIDLEALSSPTPQSRIKKRKGSGGQYLDYVDARFCMDRLDASVGPMNWRNEYKEVCGHLICGVSVFVISQGDEFGQGQWVTKWDTGTESNFEAEKGHFSDAFKRACVHWGIGRDLYGDVEPAVAKKKVAKQQTLDDIENVGNEITDQHADSLSEQMEDGENSVGVSEPVTPSSALTVDDWGSVQIHFGKNAGVPLSDLAPRSLEWYQTTWTISDKPSDDDLLLRAALDKSMKQGGNQDGFGG